MRRGRPTEDGCGPAATDCVRTNTRPTTDVEGSDFLSPSLTCGNKSDPGADKPDDEVNDDGPDQRALDAQGEQADERTAEHAAGKAPEDMLHLVVGMSAEETGPDRG